MKAVPLKRAWLGWHFEAKNTSSVKVVSVTAMVSTLCIMFADHRSLTRDPEVTVRIEYVEFAMRGGKAKVGEARRRRKVRVSAWAISPSRVMICCLLILFRRVEKKKNLNKISHLLFSVKSRWQNHGFTNEWEATTGGRWCVFSFSPTFRSQKFPDKMLSSDAGHASNCQSPPAILIMASYIELNEVICHNR